MSSPEIGLQKKQTRNPDESDFLLVFLRETLRDLRGIKKQPQSRTKDNPRDTKPLPQLFVFLILIRVICGEEGVKLKFQNLALESIF